VRAAVYDLGARKWELLWNDPTPQVPPPPPGVLEKVLTQPPRWDLPAALTQPAIGTRVKTSPVLSRGGDVFLLSETRDCLSGTRTADLWHFRLGRREPKRYALDLPDYHPSGHWDDVLDDDYLHLHLREDGFVIAHPERGVIWHLAWAWKKRACLRAASGYSNIPDAARDHGRSKPGVNAGLLPRSWEWIPYSTPKLRWAAPATNRDLGSWPRQMRDC